MSFTSLLETVRVANHDWGEIYYDQPGEFTITKCKRCGMRYHYRSLSNDHYFYNNQNHRVKKTKDAHCLS